MKRKTLSVIALFLSFSLYFSCVDDGVYVPGESHKVPETDLMAYAKQLVGENGEGCSLIDFQKDNPHSRSVTDYSTVATPLWEKAKHERLGDLEVLVVPLQSEQEIHSGMYFEQEHMERLFQTKTFSRLVIRSKGGKTLSQVFTYLPGRHYAKHRKEELDTMGFSPLSVKYYGTILISGLDGEFQQGFLYERGVPVVHFTKRKDSNSVPIRLLNDSTESECHSHDHAHSFPVRLKLTGNPTVASRSYDEGDEDIWAGYCPACGSTDIDHTCVVVWGTPNLCEDCGKPKPDCVCLPTMSRCPICNMYYCECFDTCDECGNAPCSCGGSGNNGSSGDGPDLGGGSGAGSGSGSGGGSNPSGSLYNENIISCKTLQEVRDNIPPRLERMGIVLGDIEIAESQSCNSNASADHVNYTIKICPQRFYKFPLVDQMAIIYHEYYHLKYDEDKLKDWNSLNKPLSQTIYMNPSQEIMSYYTQLYYDEYILLQYTYNSFESYLTDYCLLVRYILPSIYYRNEINAYNSEFQLFPLVSADYEAERQIAFWVNTQRFNISINNNY